MAKPYASNEKAKAKASEPIRQIYGFDETWDGRHVIVYDSPKAGDYLAALWKTKAKHSRSRFPNPHWTWFSIVRLPEGLTNR